MRVRRHCVRNAAIRFLLLEFVYSLCLTLARSLHGAVYCNGLPTSNAMRANTTNNDLSSNNMNCFYFIMYLCGYPQSILEPIVEHPRHASVGHSLTLDDTHVVQLVPIVVQRRSHVNLWLVIRDAVVVLKTVIVFSFRRASRSSGSQVSRHGVAST